jgi:hypothetical protein
VKRALAAVLVALTVAPAALADRPANHAERAAIMATVGRMGSFDPGPPKCNHPIIRVSTFDPAYATWQLPSVAKGPCSKYAGSADGLDFFKRAFASWLFLTRSPAVPVCGSYIADVPFPVIADFLHCPGGPAKAECFTTNEEGFAANLASEASSKVGDLLQACYAPVYRQIAHVGFSGLPKPHGKAVTLVVKTKLPRTSASVGKAATICRDASTVAAWYGYENIAVAVSAKSGDVLARAAPGGQC